MFHKSEIFLLQSEMPLAKTQMASSAMAFTNLFTPFQGFSPPFHYLFSRRNQAKQLKERELRRNLFRIGGAEEYGKNVQS